MGKLQKADNLSVRQKKVHFLEELEMLNMSDNQLGRMLEKTNTLVLLLEEVQAESTDIDSVVLQQACAAIDRAAVQITERYLHTKRRIAEA